MQADRIVLGCGYCMTCGYGMEPSPDCLHGRVITADEFYDAESEWPMSVQAQHHMLNVAARRCYELRDEARRVGDDDRAEYLHATGDSLFLDAMALGDEWDA